MFKMEIQLDEEKIKREGKYTVEELYAEIETLCTKYKLWKEKEPVGDEPRVYITVEDENEMAQFACVSFRLKDKLHLFDNLKHWKELEFDEDDCFDEDVLAYFKKGGYKYGRA